MKPGGKEWKDRTKEEKEIEAFYSNYALQDKKKVILPVLTANKNSL